MFRGAVCRWSGDVKALWSMICASPRLLSDLSEYIPDGMDAVSAYRRFTHAVCMRRVRFTGIHCVPNLSFALSMRRTALIMLDSELSVGGMKHVFKLTQELPSSLCRPRVGSHARRLPSELDDAWMGFLTVYELGKVRATCLRWRTALADEKTERRMVADALGYTPTHARSALLHMRLFCRGSAGDWTYRRLSGPGMHETRGAKGRIKSVTALSDGRIQFATSYGYMCTVRANLARKRRLR